MGREGDCTPLKCSTLSHFDLLYISCLTFRNSITKQPASMSDFFVTEIYLQLLKDLFLPQFILAVTSSGYSAFLFLLKEKSVEVTVAIFSSSASWQYMKKKINFLLNKPVKWGINVRWATSFSEGVNSTSETYITYAPINALNAHENTTVL